MILYMLSYICIKLLISIAWPLCSYSNQCYIEFYLGICWLVNRFYSYAFGPSANQMNALSICINQFKKKTTKLLLIGVVDWFAHRFTFKLLDQTTCPSAVCRCSYFLLFFRNLIDTWIKWKQREIFSVYFFFFLFLSKQMITNNGISREIS